MCGTCRRRGGSGRGGECRCVQVTFVHEYVHQFHRGGTRCAVHGEAIQVTVAHTRSVRHSARQERDSKPRALRVRRLVEQCCVHDAAARNLSRDRKGWAKLRDLPTRPSVERAHRITPRISRRRAWDCINGFLGGGKVSERELGKDAESIFGSIYDAPFGLSLSRRLSVGLFGSHTTASMRRVPGGGLGGGVCPTLHALFAYATVQNVHSSPRR